SQEVLLNRDRTWAGAMHKTILISNKSPLLNNNIRNHHHFNVRKQQLLLTTRLKMTVKKLKLLMMTCRSDQRTVCKLNKLVKCFYINDLREMYVCKNCV